jgi:cytochrome c
MPRSLSRHLVAVTLLAAARATAQAPDPTRFEQQVLLQGVFDEPTEIAVAQDGRVFVIERKGTVRLYDPKTESGRVVAQLEVYHQEENGLIGIALDPRFAQTRWIYLARTVGDSTHPRHRVARFTFANNTLGDERVLLEIPIDPGCCHTGGSMTFDAKGNLFVSFGDNSNPFATAYAPIDDAPGRRLWDARRSSANTQDLRGKILRITPTPNGKYTIPAGNLFADAKQGRPEIYTMGHRNPYRISVDKRSGFLYWGEVGPDAQADSVAGPKGYDEVNQARRAGNFGWPLFIADNKRYLDRDIATGTRRDYFDPAHPVNASRNNTGARDLPPAQPAFIWYPYDKSPEFPLVGEGGRTAMAGPVYHAADFTSATKIPAYYDGKLIIYEWMRGWMRAVTMNAQGDYVKMEPFLEGITFDHPMDVELGPDGSLYVLEYGTYWFAKNPNARLSRIVYHAGNRPPVAKLAADRTTGAAPLTVKLSARGSSDFDANDSLRYTWTFDGAAAANGMEVSRTFTTPGAHTVRLTVRDRAGARGVADQTLLVGNAPPAVKIAVTGNHSFFWDTSHVAYQVSATDAEDGSLGRGIAPAQVRVTLDYRPQGVSRAPAGQAGHQVDPPGLALIRRSDCLACHSVDQVSAGPSFRMVAQRYAGRDTTVVSRLVQKVIKGGGGVWGPREMAAHPALAPDVVEQMVRYVLSLASPGTVLPASGTLPLDKHGEGDSGAYVLTARYVDKVRNGVGPLEAVDEVVLRTPLVRAGDVTDVRSIGLAAGAGPDGRERSIATAYATGAYLHLGPTDLTGVGGVRVAVQPLGHAVTVELRAGGADGTLLGSAAAPAAAQDAWSEARVPLGTASGDQDLYVVLRSSAPNIGQFNPLARLDALRFEPR